MGLSIGPEGPELLVFPLNKWEPIFTRSQNGATIEAVPDQLRIDRAEIGQSDPSGFRLVVDVRGRETRIALVDDRRVIKAWQLESDMVTLGDVQLVTTTNKGEGLLLVQRAYTEMTQNYLAMRVSPEGHLSTMTLPTGDYAEAVPFGRFEYVPGSLYEMITSEEQFSIVRYDLEV
jgi:hypothetical protein